MKEKKRALGAAINSLQTNIEEYSLAAKKENSPTMLTKANSFSNSSSKEGNIIISRKQFCEIERRA